MWFAPCIPLLVIATISNHHFLTLSYLNPYPLYIYISDIPSCLFLLSSLLFQLIMLFPWSSQNKQIIGTSFPCIHYPMIFPMIVPIFFIPMIRIFSMYLHVMFLRKLPAAAPPTPTAPTAPRSAPSAGSAAPPPPRACGGPRGSAAGAAPGAPGAGHRRGRGRNAA